MTDYDVGRAALRTHRDLSGGNLQKFIMARSMKEKPRVLFCSYPTRVSYKSHLFLSGKDPRGPDRGCGIVLLSAILKSMFSLSDRLVVLCRGRIAGEVRPAEATVRQVGMMMMGVAGA